MNLCDICGARAEDGYTICSSEICVEAKRTGKSVNQIVFSDSQIVTEDRMEPLAYGGKQARRFYCE